jgi:hypothetical protein
MPVVRFVQRSDRPANGWSQRCSVVGVDAGKKPTAKMAKKIHLGTQLILPAWYGAESLQKTAAVLLAELQLSHLVGMTEITSSQTVHGGPHLNHTNALTAQPQKRASFQLYFLCPGLATKFPKMFQTRMRQRNGIFSKLANIPLLLDDY